MRNFLTWFNLEDKLDPVVKAALAHLWFVTIHPFDDGNGRIARAIADMSLARSEASPQRFYSMSAQHPAGAGMALRPEPTTQIPSLDHRYSPDAARMVPGRSYLMDAFQVMASGGEQSPTIITPTLSPSSCHRKQASLGANDESAHPFTQLFVSSVAAAVS